VQSCEWTFYKIKRQRIWWTRQNSEIENQLKQSIAQRDNVIFWLPDATFTSFMYMFTKLNDTRVPNSGQGSARDTLSIMRSVCLAANVDDVAVSMTCSSCWSWVVATSHQSAADNLSMPADQQLQHAQHCTVNTSKAHGRRERPHPTLEEASTHKSAKTYACIVFVNRDLDLSFFDPKINGFPGLILEHSGVKFSDPGCIAFLRSCRKQIHGQTEAKTWP